MLSEHKKGLVFVRGKKTKQIDVRRANEFSRSSSSTAKRTLHYVDKSRTQVCRCRDSRRHHGPISAVASDSTHLNANLELYMARHDFESCSITDYQSYLTQRKATWARIGVNVEKLHYVSMEKDSVCRCPNTCSHSVGMPRNPYIIEQCAELFSKRIDLRICSKNQWQGVEEVPSQDFSPTVQNDCLEFDCQSTLNSLLGRAIQQQQQPSLHHPPTSADMETPSRYKLMDLIAKQQRQSAVLIESGVPELVWQNVRPPIWRSLHGSDSVVSTTLGILSPVATNTPSSCYPSLSTHERASHVISWSTMLRDANVSNIQNSLRTSGAQISHCTIFEKDDDKQATKFAELGDSRPVPSACNTEHKLQGIPAMAELSSYESACELEAERPRLFRQHAATLKKLEGC